MAKQRTRAIRANQPFRCDLGSLTFGESDLPDPMPFEEFMSLARTAICESMETLAKERRNYGAWQSAVGLFKRGLIAKETLVDIADKTGFQHAVELVLEDMANDGQALAEAES